MVKCVHCNGEIKVTEHVFFHENGGRAHAKPIDCISSLTARLAEVQEELRMVRLAWDSDIKIAADAMRERNAALTRLAEAESAKLTGDMRLRKCRARLAEAEAAARWWRMAARGYILEEGEVHPDERWPWLVNEAADEAAKEEKEYLDFVCGKDEAKGGRDDND